ncbi:Hypothetical predicted protein [Xyrichtys novacula]|uniref:Uncharacterized protein n=1 Tax=Xyrichtys novacula TaxID=13765 RepID=A0AAV1EY64_XYRNO|nr:Hypothetical predicted protein [Xyrichtys novacula]
MSVRHEHASVSRLYHMPHTKKSRLCCQPFTSRSYSHSTGTIEGRYSREHPVKDPEKKPVPPCGTRDGSGHYLITFDQRVTDGRGAHTHTHAHTPLVRYTLPPRAADARPVPPGRSLVQG